MTSRRRNPGYRISGPYHLAEDGPQRWEDAEPIRDDPVLAQEPGLESIALYVDHQRSEDRVLAVAHHGVIHASDRAELQLPKNQLTWQTDSRNSKT